MPKSGRPYIKGEMGITKPKKRHDGEMYERPEPNPFTNEWNMGYDDGFESRDRRDVGTKLDQIRYDDGYDSGQEERREMDRAGSSNT